MMPPEDRPAEINEQENQGSNSGSRKTRPPEQSLKCPRCDSPNTKFCYYNNYSLSQPRHFCKTCRRYWTNGGALRNVPIGGGCRKNKKVKASSSRLSSDSRDSGSSSSSDQLGSLRFLTGLSSPTVEFQFGGLPFPTRLQHHGPSTGALFNNQNQNQFSTFGDAINATGSPGYQFNLDPPGSTNSLLGLNFPFSCQTGSGFNGANAMNVNSSLASSIESLSNMNQDLHWKLQQQRFATTMFGVGDNNYNGSQRESNVSVSLSPLINLESANQQVAEKPHLQPILFQNLEISNADQIFPTAEPRKEGPNAETEWFFGNPYSSVTVTPTTTTTTGSGSGNAQEDDNANNNWSTAVPAWVDLQQPYSALP